MNILHQHRSTSSWINVQIYVIFPSTS
uniref:Uncharacterized protein n=1 Tax=Romanomermis culicivorax TaxID=13658 RepID=A0A915HH79_ROMCU